MTRLQVDEPKREAEPTETAEDVFSGEAIVLEKQQAADGVCVLALGAIGGALPAWTPGSHVDIYIDGLPTRQYSLCGDPSDRRRYRLGVLRNPIGGATSNYIHDRLEVGDHVRLGGPRNHFELVPSRRYIFVAGGIGITPLLPMIAQAEASGSEWRLAYGGRTRASMAFLHELDQYGTKVSFFPEDETGLLDLASILVGPDSETAIYCCGPEPLLAAIESECSKWPAGALRTERFAPTATDEAPPNKSFEVDLAASGMTVVVPADKSILDAVRGAGVQIESSCREGICGTCEVQVVEGLPDHRDFVLDVEERNANDCMMVCVSRSLLPRLVLDL
jgi:ferredoxin-NADP reductase